MGIQLANNATALTVGAITGASTQLTVGTGYGALFPELGAGDYFYATLVSVSGTREIVKVTARTDDVFTIDRAQEGTAALSFPDNSRVELRVTAANILSKFEDLDFLLL